MNDWFCFRIQFPPYSTASLHSDNHRTIVLNNFSELAIASVISRHLSSATKSTADNRPFNVFLTASLYVSRISFVKNFEVTKNDPGFILYF